MSTRFDLSPLAAADRLRGAPGRVVLHSGRDDDELGRWSFVAAEPRATLTIRGRSLVRCDGSGTIVEQATGDPLDAIERFLAEHGCALGAAADPVHARTGPVPHVIGYLGYDLARAIERLGAGPAVGNDCPDAWLAAYGAVARWRSDAGTGEVVGDSEPGRQRLLDALLVAPATAAAPPLFAELGAEDPARYLARCRRILRYLGAGDVYQVNLARRLVAAQRRPGDALALYRALAARSPAPYGALLETGAATILSSSPERFLASVGARVETRPIKGTRRRHDGDDGAAAELAAAEKDGAEHLMILDLERNDLGRIAVPGSVRVDRSPYVVELPALLHLVSRVSAEPAPDVGFARLLRATFPGGSITGAPKVRAMQIIDELEPVRRGPYCGALGWFGAGGQFDLAMAIRIGVLAGGELRVHVGGGIVADSDPEAELAETEAKAVGWRAALAALAEASDQFGMSRTM